jgi:hypothetical protein
MSSLKAEPLKYPPVKLLIAAFLDIWCKKPIIKDARAESNSLGRMCRILRRLPSKLMGDF